MPSAPERMTPDRQYQSSPPRANTAAPHRRAHRTPSGSPPTSRLANGETTFGGISARSPRLYVGGISIMAIVALS
ncbi:MAG: hypothetical protein AAGC68_11185, partial [Verrucomicrobiota bacterium]